MHYINSCAKSLVSMLLGIALEAHDSLNADTPLYKFFPQFDSLFTPKKEKSHLNMY